MDPLGRRLFPERTIPCVTKSAYPNNTTQPAPGYPLLASNIMTRLWNTATVPGLKTATSLGEANAVARKWAKTFAC